MVLVEDGDAAALLRWNALQAWEVQVVWMLVRDPDVVHLAEIDSGRRTEKCPAVVEGLADEPWITHERRAGGSDAEASVSDESDLHMKT
jgi:hypothetical protein